MDGEQLDNDYRSIIRLEVEKKSSGLSRFSPSKAFKSVVGAGVITSLILSNPKEEIKQVILKEEKEALMPPNRKICLIK